MRSKTHPFRIVHSLSGIGGGIIQKGCIYHGQHPGEVEIGHARIPFSGLFPDKWPILETLCSGWSLDEKLRSIIKSHPDSLLSQLTRAQGGGKETRFLNEARQSGDPHAMQVWNELCMYLALALSHVVHLFHPQILILGGGVSQLGEPWIKDIRSYVAQLVMKAYERTYEVVLSQVGEDVIPVGSLLLASSLL